MVQFEYNKVMKRHDVKLPFTLVDESDMVMVASITEENKVVLHRDLSINLLRQILMHWDEYEHQMERESEDLLIYEPKNKILTYLKERRQGRWEDIPIARVSECKYLNFSTRTWNILKTAGINTVGELVKKSKRDLCKQKNCGRKSLWEIEEKLSEVGLTLKQ